MSTRGIYFLANDKVRDQAIAFLNSARTHNPEVPMCLIPYDGRTERIRSLSGHFNFDVLEDEELMDWCDAISLQFHEPACRGRGMYRKLAAWFGPFDEFLYMDLDTLLLRPVDFLFPLLREFDAVTAYSNDPASRGFVWLDSLQPNADISQAQIDYAANMGFILSHRGMLTRGAVEGLLPAAKRLAPHMQLECFDQTFNNYVITCSARRYTSLRCLNLPPENRGLPEECWPGNNLWRLELDGRATFDGVPREVLHVHWSGIMSPQRWEKRVYSWLARLKLPVPSVKFRLQQGHLWRHYRNLADWRDVAQAGRHPPQRGGRADEAGARRSTLTDTLPVPLSR